MEEKTKHILEKATNTVLDESILLSVDIKPKNNTHRSLQRWGILPVKKIFAVRPIVYGNLVRISKLLLGIDTAVLNSGSMIEGNYRLMGDYAKIIAKVIAIAIHNRKKEPSDSLIDFIYYNFSSKEGLQVLKIVQQQMGVTDFMTTIILARGLNVLENEPKTNGRVSPTEKGR